ncbi:MAG: phenylalanine--tRNA ligase subunit beta [bacterium]
MLVSFNWIKQYVDLPDSITAEEVADRLTMGVVEVESINNMGASLDKIVVGKITKVENHPNADKLKVCIVDDGSDSSLKVVCGGSNIVKGMKVAFAQIGAKVQWHGQGDLVLIEKTKIRGEESNGMICASTEIGLEEMFPLKDNSEIVDLNKLGAKVGLPLAKALGLDDLVFEIENKSMNHRPDLWGHYGLAREVATMYNKELGKYDPPVLPRSALSADEKIKLEVEVEDSVLCPRYTAVVIKGIKVSQSPDWMKKRLASVGLRPINNIVDITNYVMMDLGQPMHAFDLSKLSFADNKILRIVARKAKKNEKIFTIDKTECELDERDIMICDNEKPIALAGIMGGVESEISESTDSIVLECANFDPPTVRRTSTRLGLRSESSTRFEKSLDPNNTMPAMQRAVQLILECCPNSKVASKVVDKKDFSLKTGPFEVEWDFLYKKLGKELDKKDVLKILSKLGFEVKEGKHTMSIKVPSWRATKDISIREDVVEEVARVYGYGNIEPIAPLFAMDPPAINELRALQTKVMDVFVKTMGYSEAYNYSFISAHQIESIGQNIEDHLELKNPISKEKPYLRRTLVPNLLDNIKKNIEYFDEVKIIECGKTFIAEEFGEKSRKNSDDLLPRQDTWLSAVFCAKKNNNPFLQIRATIEQLCAVLNSEFNFISVSNPQPYYHLARMATLAISEVEIGHAFELNPLIQKNFNLESRVGCLEINLTALLEAIKGISKKIKRLPIYPEVYRDLAIVVDNEITHNEIVQFIVKISNLVKDIKLFDVYSGKGIIQGRKSMAFHVVFYDNERTLASNEADVLMDKIIKGLEKKFRAEART